LRAAPLLRAQGCIAYLSYVHDVRDAPALRQALLSVPGAQYFDQLRYLERAYATLRTRTFHQVCLGLLAVIALCAWRYRSLRAGVAVIMPASLSSVLAIAVLGMVGAQVTVFHFAAALLVLSMGEDYAVFLLEAKRDPQATVIASVSIFIACLTTVVSFGLLSLSAHPALASLGLVVALGVFFSLILAPTALLIAGHGALNENL
jgi:predicted exporter